MSVKIAIDKMKIVHKVNEAWKKGLSMLTEEILNDTNDFVKFDTGALMASSYIHTDFKHGKLIWQTPYARRQYWEIKTAVTDINPRATWRWFEAAKRTHSAKWQMQAQRAVEMNL